MTSKPTLPEVLAVDDDTLILTKNLIFIRKSAWNNCYYIHAAGDRYNHFRVCPNYRGYHEIDEYHTAHMQK
jgi:hypothetical protein